MKLFSRTHQHLRAIQRWFQTRPLAPPATKAQRGAIDAMLFSLASIGAVAAYTFQPFQRFAPPQGLLTGGMLLVFGLAPLVVARHVRVVTGIAWVALPLLVLASTNLVFTARDAFKQNDWNDRRCWRIQQAMLKPSGTTRSDLPEVFTALACPPQGGAPVDGSYHPTRNTPPSPAALAAHQAFLQNALEAEVRIDRAADVAHEVDERSSERGGGGSKSH